MKSALRYVTTAGRTVMGMGRLSSVYVRCSLTKRSAVKQFVRELEEFDIPEDVVEQLKTDYAGMVNLNPLAYRHFAGN